jgi:hypothetical protein
MQCTALHCTALHCTAGVGGGIRREGNSEGGGGIRREGNSEGGEFGGGGGHSAPADDINKKFQNGSRDLKLASF